MLSTCTARTSNNKRHFVLLYSRAHFIDVEENALGDAVYVPQTFSRVPFKTTINNHFLKVDAKSQIGQAGQRSCKFVANNTAVMQQ